MRPLLFAACLMLMIALGGCSKNVATGRLQFDMMSTEQEVAMGTEAKPELIQEYGGEVQSPQLKAYVDRVGRTLAQYTEAEGPSLPWEFIVVDSEVINAFALPGGKVFISRGLLERFDNEAQVAGVLGHEIGHVTAQHVDERISQATGVSIIAQGAGIASNSELIAQVIGMGGQGYLLKFNRDQESEADILGVRYMVKAGYNPHGMLEVLEVLREASAGGQQPEFLSTHPHPETRLKTVTRLLNGEYAYTQNNPEFREYADRFQRDASPYLNASK
jgi:predicted Zn-dependent protease